MADLDKFYTETGRQNAICLKLVLAKKQYKRAWENVLI
jgi:hypothetical protein